MPPFVKEAFCSKCKNSVRLRSEDIRLDVNDGGMILKRGNEETFPCHGHRISAIRSKTLLTNDFELTVPDLYLPHYQLVNRMTSFVSQLIVVLVNRESSDDSGVITTQYIQ